MIQKYRKIAGRTQEWLAERTGYSVGTVKAWELDIREPKREQIKALAIALNATQDLPVEWVMQDPKERTTFKLENLSLSETAMRFIKELNDVVKLTDNLIDIVFDNEITFDERIEFENIMKEIIELVAAGQILTIRNKSNSIKK